MTYNEKKKLCKEINNDRINDIVCACYKDIKGAERLQVFLPCSPHIMRSKPCTRWSEDNIKEWIINATIQLNGLINDELFLDSSASCEAPFD